MDDVQVVEFLFEGFHAGFKVGVRIDPAETLANPLCEAAVFRNFRESDLHQFERIGNDEGGGLHGGKHHRAVDSISAMRPMRIAPREFGGTLNVARAGVGIAVRPDLRTDPFAIGIAVRADPLSILCDVMPFPRDIQHVEHRLHFRSTNGRNRQVRNPIARDVLPRKCRAVLL